MIPVPVSLLGPHGLPDAICQYAKKRQEKKPYPTCDVYRSEYVWQDHDGPDQHQKTDERSPRKLASIAGTEYVYEAGGNQQKCYGQLGSMNDELYTVRDDAREQVLTAVAAAMYLQKPIRPGLVAAFIRRTNTTDWVVVIRYI